MPTTGEGDPRERSLRGESSHPGYVKKKCEGDSWVTVWESNSSLLEQKGSGTRDHFQDESGCDLGLRNYVGQKLKDLNGNIKECAACLTKGGKKTTGNSKENKKSYIEIMVQLWTKARYGMILATDRAPVRRVDFTVTVGRIFHQSGFSDTGKYFGGHLQLMLSGPKWGLGQSLKDEWKFPISHHVMLKFKRHSNMYQLKKWRVNSVM